MTIEIKPVVEVSEEYFCQAIWMWHHHVVEDGSNNEACGLECKKSFTAALQKAFNQGREYERKQGQP